MKREFGLFDFLRFFASIIVMIYHVPLEPTIQNKLPLLLKDGNVWVYFFFIISGYFSAYTYKDKLDPLSYVKSKIEKIYPTYFIGLIIVFISLGKFLRPLDYISPVLLIQSWLLRYLPFMDPGWYLSSLLFLYLCFPYVFKIGEKNKKRLFIMNVILLSYSMYFINRLSHLEGINTTQELVYLTRYFPPLMLGVYIIGVSIYFITENMKRKKYISFLILLYLTGMLFFFQTHSYFNNIVSFSPLIILIVLDNGFMARICDNKLFIYLAKLSFPIYILHMPIFYVFNGLNQGFANNWKKVLIYYSAVLLFSILLLKIQKHNQLLIKAKENM